MAKGRLIFLTALFAVFTIYSTLVVIQHGYSGFLTLAGNEPWALQMLIDLVIALLLFTSWMLRDARERAISPWPYLVGILTLGSIGALAYLVRREFPLGTGSENVRV